MDKKSDRTRVLLSSNLKRYRQAMGLSQLRFSELLGMGHSMLAAIESMDKFPSPESLTRISQALKIEVYELFQPTDQTTSKDLKDIGSLREILKEDISSLLDEKFKDFIVQ